MNLLEKSLQVRQVFDELQLETDRFISQSKVSCIQGCGLCCTNPKVSASITEFLPLAFDLYYKGKAEQFLSLLDSASEDSYCIILKNTSVDADALQCSDYRHRGLICTLFASSHRKINTFYKELLICKKINAHKQEAYEAVAKAINQHLDVPLSSAYYTRLYNI